MIKKDFFGEFIKGSIVLFVIINLFNFLNYAFHFAMARMLSPSDYGILAVLMSLVFIYAIPAEAIQTIITKHASKLNIKKEYGKMKDMLYDSLKKGILIASVVFILFNVFCFFVLSEVLDIDFLLLFISNIMIFSFFLFPVIRGILQGRKRFCALGINMLLESMLKLILALILVYIGFGVYGAIFGVVLAFIIFLILSFLFIKEIIHSKKIKHEIRNLYTSNIPIFIVVSGIVLFYSLDIIIAKAVFEPDLAGKYAVLSMIGKMIFFGTYAISKAMFPISVQRFEEKEHSGDLLKKSSLLVSIICLFAILIIGLFPKLIIQILFGSQYLGVSNYLVYLAIGFSFLCMSNLFLIYGLSKNKIKLTESFVMIFFILSEIVLLSIFNKTLIQFITIFIILNVAMFLWSLIIVRK